MEEIKLRSQKKKSVHGPPLMFCVNYETQVTLHMPISP